MEYFLAIVLIVNFLLGITWTTSSVLNLFIKVYLFSSAGAAGFFLASLTGYIVKV